MKKGLSILIGATALAVLVTEAQALGSGPPRAADWKPMSGAPAAVAVEQGVAFPCRFSRGDDRFYWDRELRADLSGARGLVVDISCDRPGALRSLMIYLRSGNGWYVWGKPLAEAGSQRLLLSRSQFTAEGSPAGWDRIDAIRLSAWKGQAVNARLVLHRLEVMSVSVAVLEGTRSARTAGDKAVARRAARRIGAWLDDNGVPHAADGEESVAALLAGTRVAILPFNPDPPAEVLSALRSYVAKGGKLIVFFSSSPDLAALMQMRLGPYLDSDDPARWSQIVFTDPARWHVPARVLQSSWNIRPVQPAGEDGAVIAWWADAAGRVSKDPAWVASSRGFWMTHIPLEDDTRSKRRMITALAAHLDPSIWPLAGARAFARAGKVDGFTDLESSRRGILRTADTEMVRGRLAAAESDYQRMLASRAQGDWAGVCDTEARLRQHLTEAYGLAQAPRPGELRGVWDHSGLGWYPGDWDRTCRILAENGINAIFINALWAGLAHYPSRAVPSSNATRLYGDQMEACVRAARRHGLQVHVWKVCWNLDRAPADLVARLGREGRLQTDAGGRTVQWLDPAVAGNEDYELQAIREVVTRYAVDGVHLDYIRYPDANASFSPACRAAFERDTGRKVTSWPADVRGTGVRAREFQSWRAGLITRLVRRARDEVRAARPGAKLSAAVWGSHEVVRASIGQDWPLWLRNGYVDFVCPMNYTEHLAEFSALLAKQASLPGARGRLYPGLGVTAAESQLSADKVIEQILAARRAEAPGFVLFDLSPTLREETLPILRLGLTKPP